MADGQVVLVTTEPLEAIIAAMMAPNEKVEAWGRLPEAAVKALGLKRGDFTHG